MFRFLREICIDDYMNLTFVNLTFKLSRAIPTDMNLFQPSFLHAQAALCIHALYDHRSGSLAAQSCSEAEVHLSINAKNKGVTILFCLGALVESDKIHLQEATV